MSKKISFSQRIFLLANRRFSMKDPVFISIAVFLLLVGVIVVIHAEAYQATQVGVY